MAGTGFENVAESQRAERRVAAGAAAADRQGGCRQLLRSLDEIARAIDTVIDIDDPPLALEPFSVRAAVARAAAVIYVEHGDPAASPVLD